METPKKRDNFYWDELNRPFVSVTHVLSSVLNKPSITYWYGQSIYREVIKDPSIDEKTAMAAPYKISREAAGRGTTIHSLIESYRRTGSVIESVPPELKGYANAFYDWVNSVKPTILDAEKRVYEYEMGYAGQYDMLAEIGGKKYVIDFKTSKKGEVYDEAHMQVSAYIHCLEGVKDGIIVALAEDGHYTAKTCRNGFEAFKHALGLYVFINEDKLAKYGWKGTI